MCDTIMEISSVAADSPPTLGLVSESVITQSMLSEEKALQAESEKNKAAEREKALAELDRDIEQMRYRRLQHLLERSNFFSEFLMKKMEDEMRTSVRVEVCDETQTVGRKRRTRRNGTRRAKRMKCDVYEKGSGFSQPKLVTGGRLRPYQLEGTNWMRVLYENGIHGILGDEMGLGKTVQCIALLAHLIEMGVTGPFLVAAPLSTLPNWMSEFKRFAPTIPTLLYHGSKPDRKLLRDKLLVLHNTTTQRDTKSYPVVITSYEIIMNDRQHLEKLAWKYLIVDEGHRIKNLNCRLIRELKRYRTANRLLLTGTPLQNSLAELWSLLNFLLPDIFDDLNTFQSWFDFATVGQIADSAARIIALEKERHVLDMLHKILTPFLLRRLKSDVELEIPPKKEIIVYAPLSHIQETQYKACLDNSLLQYVRRHNNQTVKHSPSSDKENQVDRPTSHRQRRLSTKAATSYNEDALWEKTLSAAAVSPKTHVAHAAPCAEINVKVNNMQMQMRKVCNHPYLIEYPLTRHGQYRVDEELVTSCGKMKLLDCLLSALKKEEHKILLFSQMTSMLDIVEDYLGMRRYDYCRLDGTMTFAHRQEQIETFNSDPNVFVFLLSTRAGGLGLNLTAADTVIIYDSDWNPQGDIQAQDRCHRIHQTKPVLVYRLVTANTIDQRMVERATTKRKLEKIVLHKEKFKGSYKSSEMLTTESLLELLQSSEHDAEVNWSAGSQFLKDEELKLLLDRTNWEGRPADSHKLFDIVDEVTPSDRLRSVESISVD